MISYFEQPERI